MNWINLALANQLRRPLRTLVTMAGVAISIGALFSLLAFQQGYQNGMQSEMDHLGAHILVVPKGCPYDAASIALHGARWPCFLKESYLRDVHAASKVATAAPVFMSARDDTAGAQTVYVGVDSNILALKRNWRITGSFPRREGDLLVGADVIHRMGWKLGQTVELPGLDHQNGTLNGTLMATGGPDDGFIYIRLQDAQHLFGHPHELTHILVRLRDPNDLEVAVSELHSCDAGMDMNVVPLTHLFGTIRTLVSSTRVLLGAILSIALLVAGFGVSNTVLIAVVERTQEIGVMRATGASRSQIFGLLLLETLQVCLAGGILGIGLSFLGARLLETWLRTQLPFAPTDPLIQWQWWMVAASLACCMTLGSLASLLPAWRASHLSPLEAMRSPL